MNDRPSVSARLLHGLDVLRRLLLDLLFFGILVALAIALWSGRPRVPDGAALVVKPVGTIVEQLSPSDPLQQYVAGSAGAPSVAKETLLKGSRARSASSASSPRSTSPSPGTSASTRTASAPPASRTRCARTAPWTRPSRTWCSS